jgi:hypothetical protein
VADFENGHVTWWPGTQAGELPACDLFSKQARNIKGRVAARWFWEGDDRYRSESGRVLTGQQLIERLRESSTDLPYILQVRLTNHAELEPVVGGHLRFPAWGHQDLRTPH